MEDDVEQLKLDLADAQDRVRVMRHAVNEKDEAEEQVRQCVQALRQARRRLKEACWNLSAVLAREERKPVRSDME